MIKQCELCGEEYNGRSTSRYCSKECSEKIRIQRQKQYSQMQKYKRKKPQTTPALSSYVEEARKMGLSYGKYMVWLEGQRRTGNDKGTAKEVSAR